MTKQIIIGVLAIIMLICCFTYCAFDKILGYAQEPSQRWSQRLERQVNKDNPISLDFCIIQDYWGGPGGMNQPDRVSDILEAYAFAKQNNYKEGEVEFRMKLMQGRDVQTGRYLFRWVTEREVESLRDLKGKSFEEVQH